MTLLAALIISLALPALAIRAPSQEEQDSLATNTAEAFKDRQSLRDLENNLRSEVEVENEDPDWELLLTPNQKLRLSAARLRSDAAMATLLEETLIAYGLVQVKPSPAGGSPVPLYPNEIMQGGDFKGSRREWRVIYAQPVEGTVRDENGVVLRGDDFKEFLRTHNGMTSPDGTTIVWGDFFRVAPHKLPIVLRHELAHYELFADKDWVDTKTNAEREEEAYARSRDAVWKMGFDPKVAKVEAQIQNDLGLSYSAQKSTEKGQSERRTWWQLAEDRAREFFGLKPRPEDPGYTLSHGFSMNPEAWARIRGDGERLKARADGQRQERAMDSLAADICADPKSAADPAQRRRFQAVTGSRRERTIPAPDPCVQLIGNVLWQAKADGGQDYDARAISLIVPTRSSPVTESDSIRNFQLSQLAEEICRIPTEAWSKSLAERFRRIARITDDRPPTPGRTCRSRVLSELWRQNRLATGTFDPGPVFEQTTVPTVVDAPAVLPPPVRPVEPPAPAPPPAEPPPSFPEPKLPPGEPIPPCLHDRCADWN